MKRTHAPLVSLVLAAAVILGSFAAIRSTRLSTQASAQRVDAAQIARQNAALDRAEAALRAELAKKPPALAALPAGPRAIAPQTVVYRRAPAVVRVIHRHGDDDGHERDHEGGELDD
jgi:hypothetical protein